MCSRIFLLSGSEGVWRQILRQTPGGRKTPRALPRVADPIIERKRQHLHGDQPWGGSTESWQDEDDWHVLQFLKLDRTVRQPNDFGASNLSTCFLSVSIKNIVTVLVKGIVRFLEESHQLHLTGDIWSSNMVTCTRVSNKEKLNNVVFGCWLVIDVVS